MNDNGQAKFINNIRKALCVDGKNVRPDLFSGKSREESMIILDGIGNRSHSARLQLLEKLIGAAKLINLDVIPVKTLSEAAQEIVKLACEKKPEWGEAKSIVAWRHPLVDKMNLGDILSVHKIGLFFTDCSVQGKVEKQNLIAKAASSFIGITSADYCIAETGTLVLKTVPGNERVVSLLPSIHVAVIGLDKIIADFKELYTLFDRDLKNDPEGMAPGMTFITGPSKTADIEATMVHGAHGPREVYVYVIIGT